MSQPVEDLDALIKEYGITAIVKETIVEEFQDSSIGPPKGSEESFPSQTVD